MFCDGDINVILTFASIVVPFLISEMLPFCKCASNGLFHFFYEKLKK